jgi:hypothetical protein
METILLKPVKKSLKEFFLPSSELFNKTTFSLKDVFLSPTWSPLEPPTLISLKSPLKKLLPELLLLFLELLYPLWSELCSYLEDKVKKKLLFN